MAPLNKNDALMLCSIADMMSRDDVMGLNLPGVARLIRRVMEAKATEDLDREQQIEHWKGRAESAERSLRGMLKMGA